MHELGITQNLLQVAIRHAGDLEHAQITDLYLVIGELSSVVDDSVQFYWDFVSQGTIAAGSCLHFRRIPALMNCLTCAHSYSLAEGLSCPICDSIRVQVTAGEEFYLEAIDVEQAALETVP